MKRFAALVLVLITMIGVLTIGHAESKRDEYYELLWNYTWKRESEGGPDTIHFNRGEYYYRDGRLSFYLTEDQDGTLFFTYYKSAHHYFSGKVTFDLDGETMVLIAETYYGSDGVLIYKRQN